MVVREVVVNAFYNRVKAGDMKVEQLPLPYQPLVQELIDIEGEREQKELEEEMSTLEEEVVEIE